MIIIYILVTFLFILVCFGIYAVYRLNYYISSLETKLEKQITLTENLFQSLREIVAEDALENDGRLKKFRIQKERNFIYNGMNADSSEFTL